MQSRTEDTIVPQYLMTGHPLQSGYLSKYLILLVSIVFDDCHKHRLKLIAPVAVLFNKEKEILQSVHQFVWVCK